MAVTYIELHVRLVQLSHFNIAKLFNDHILFQEHISNLIQICLFTIYCPVKFHFHPASLFGV